MTNFDSILERSGLSKCSDEMRLILFQMYTNILVDAVQSILIHDLELKRLNPIEYKKNHDGLTLAVWKIGELFEE